MHQQIHPINCISRLATYTLDAVYLGIFMEAVYNYEPAIGTIIEELCGVFKRHRIKPIITGILDHYMTFLPNNPMTRPGDGGSSSLSFYQFHNNQNMASIRSTTTDPNNVGLYVGRAVDNDLVGLHCDIMAGHHINQTGNTNHIFNRTEMIDSICQHWGLVWRSGGGMSAQTNTSIDMIKTMLNNQVDGECCIIFNMINPTYHDNMCSAHGKEMVEIVIPRLNENMEIILKNISYYEIFNVTKKNFSKVYRGMFVESLRQYLNIPRQMMMTEEQEMYWQHHRSQHAFESYYNNYLTESPRSLELLAQT